MNVLIAILGLMVAVVAAQAVPDYFPRDKVTNYKYTVDVKSGLLYPAEFTSEYGIECRLSIEAYNSDPKLKNAYYVKVKNVKHRLFNGKKNYDERPPSLPLPVSDAAASFEEAFVIVFDKYGQLEGLKFVENETPWSKNIKRSIASMLQLDMRQIFKQHPINRDSFISRERTIHGLCNVAYDVDQSPLIPPRRLVVTKRHDPMTCSDFSYQTFNNIEHQNCHIIEESPVTTTNSRVFEIENYGHHILIKKLIGHGDIKYSPWQARAEGHYTLTNQTMIFEGLEEPFGSSDRMMRFAVVPVDPRITYAIPERYYAATGDMDVTQGRHTVRLPIVINEMKDLLQEAAHYLKEEHMSQGEPRWKHGQTINRILYLMRFMNLESMEEVFNGLKNPSNVNDEKMKNIYLGIVPNSGTTAACLFIRNVIQQKKVSPLTAAMLLTKLPSNVKVASETLLQEMEVFLEPLVGPLNSPEVTKASILCFSTLMRKAYKDGTITPHRRLYMEKLMDGLKTHPSLEMKIVYLMGLKNTGLLEVLYLLEPIIRGEVEIDPNPSMIRAYAMWAIKDVSVKEITRSENLLWPILSNNRLPMPLRVGAYEVLMHIMLHKGSMMQMHWFMIHEKDEHLYNYHIETIKGLASSTDPCLLPIQEMARKILQFTRNRNIRGSLSTKFHIDSHDHKYGHSEAVKMSLLMDPTFGLPYVGSMNLYSTIGRKPASRLGVHWYAEGVPFIIQAIQDEFFGSAATEITKQNLKRLMEDVDRNEKFPKPGSLYVILTGANDNVVAVLHQNILDFKQLLSKLNWWKQLIADHDKQVNAQHIFYEDNYEMHVATDFGVPAVLATKTPVLDSVRLNVVHSTEEKVVNMQVKFRYQEWKHGEYFMSVYNPLVNAWHAVRRTGTRDIVVPLSMAISFDAATQNVVFSVSRQPKTEYSTMGLLTHAKNFVSVMDDASEALSTSCPQCSHIETVTGGISNKVHQLDVHVRDNALRYYMGIYNCEGHVTPLPIAEWFNVLSVDHTAPMSLKKYTQILLRLRQKITNDMISSQSASCSNLMKVEPSAVYPAEQVDYSFKIQIKDTPSAKMSALEARKIDIRGTINVKGESNISKLHWDGNVDIQLSAGHTSNRLKAMFTRIIPKEMNHKVCIDGHVEYPEFDSDPFNHTVTKKETTGKLTVVMGKTTDNKCVRDEMDVSITMKGEQSDEQKHEHPANDELGQACQNHINNELLQTEKSHVPKTFECVKKAVLDTTLRRYTVNMALKKVPQYVSMQASTIEKFVHGIFFAHSNFTSELVSPGNVKVLLNYSTWTPMVDVGVITPINGYQLLQLPFGDKVWNMLMQNVQFPVHSLVDYVQDRNRMCTAYPKVVNTYDNNIVPKNISEDCWTVLSAVRHTREHIYVVALQKVMDTKLGMYLELNEHSLKILPNGTNLSVVVNGKDVSDYANGFVVPSDQMESYAIKLSSNYDHLIIQSTWTPITILYTPNSVTVVANTKLRGHTFGLCGAMNNEKGHDSVTYKIVDN
ncbi:uncharacterized protein LOC128889579 [Hylaeus anthracinus]|uniref:uncharacterized protein LOC128889579 n=1 Tax=Hylaeus anthracinus TaxID=313031 RepID=UPI0023B88A1F|nr:uncharacterized protein LOC128889579 [Hylaeus anthracinus]